MYRFVKTFNVPDFRRASSELNLDIVWAAAEGKILGSDGSCAGTSAAGRTCATAPSARSD
jgi:hypothetical protein